jgi:uncharacterized protein (DUF2236 family)
MKVSPPPDSRRDRSSSGRLLRIESLDPQKDCHEIARLFFADFRSVMLPHGLKGLLFTFAAPRMSRLLAATGEFEKRLAKRVVDTILFSHLVLEHGVDEGEGREAARRVEAMHRRYDIAPDDFLAVGCDEVLSALELAGRYGWRPVSEVEQVALRHYHDMKSRAYGSPRPLPPTIAAMQAFWNDYLDSPARYEPQNERLAASTLGYFRRLLPRVLRPLAPAILLSQVDPRIVRACGMHVPSNPSRWLSHRVFTLAGWRDPTPDTGAEHLAKMAAAVYPEGWRLADLGPDSREGRKGARPGGSIRDR